MTRTFIAADIDEAFLDGAAAIPISLPTAGARRVKRETMHVTLFFFGDVDDDRVAELKAIVATLPTDPIAVRATRLEAYPRPARANVLALALEDDPSGSLRAMHERLGQEDRPFRPHLTLCRFKSPTNVRDLIESARIALEGRVVAITLYSSVLGQNGPTYTALARHMLGATAGEVSPR